MSNVEEMQWKKDKPKKGVSDGDRVNSVYEEDMGVHDNGRKQEKGNYAYKKKLSDAIVSRKNSQRDCGR